MRYLKDEPSQHFLGRQPIFDRSMQLFGYELLYRRKSVDDRAEIIDQNLATRHVLSNTMLEFGMETITGGVPALINVGTNFIRSGECSLLPCDRVVLEILETVEVDQAILAELRRLKSLGFRIALDDFTYSDQLADLVELADIVKIDIQQFSPEELEDQLRFLLPYRKTLLAEKIERQEQLDSSLRFGFDLFQGYLLGPPTTLTGIQPPFDRWTTLLFLIMVDEPNAKLPDLSELIRRDEFLVVRLVNYFQSSLKKHSSAVRDVGEIAERLGIEGLKRWANLLAFGMLAQTPFAEPAPQESVIGQETKISGTD